MYDIGISTFKEAKKYVKKGMMNKTN